MWGKPVHVSAKHPETRVAADQNLRFRRVFSCAAHVSNAVTLAFLQLDVKQNAVVARKAGRDFLRSGGGSEAIKVDKPTLYRCVRHSESVSVVNARSGHSSPDMWTQSGDKLTIQGISQKQCG